MKKNKMMRLASCLLVAVMLTTSVISGTFAKYVTTDSGQDQARVAKWGVQITLADDMDLFNTVYDTDDANATVKHTGTTNLVAPGTKGSMSFAIAGTPEVAVKLDVTADGEAIQLAAGEYTLEKGKFAQDDVTVTTNGVYEPVRFYFGDTAVTDQTQYTLTLAELIEDLEDLSETFYAPNTQLDKTYYIGWQWAFENSIDGVATEFTTENAPYNGAKVVDFLDTYLGDEATLQTEKLELSITVTQVD